jgi:hypothetical protein
MRKDEIRYFTFPLELLQDAFSDIRKVCEVCVHYSIYAKALEYAKLKNKSVDKHFVEMAIYYYGFGFSDTYKELEISNHFYYSMIEGPAKVKVSLRKEIVIDYLKNEKSEFEIVSLLAFAALRSMIQTKSFYKTNNEQVLARMAGFSKASDCKVLPFQLQVYTKRYHMDKLKSELCRNWNLVLYGIHTKGFFVSFKLTYEQLVRIVESKRASTVDKLAREKQKEILKKILSEIHGK